MSSAQGRSMQPMVSSDMDVKIAWLYHVEGMTQAAIAELIGVSRVKVMRSLAAVASRKTLVTTINARSADQIALERRLERRWGLASAVVVPTPTDPRNLGRSIGHAVAQFISARVQDGTSLAIGGGATLHTCLDFLERRELPGASVVGLVGALAHARWINPSIVALLVGQRLGADSYQLTAPVVVDSAALREMLWAQEALRDVRRRAQAADLSILTVGEVAPSATTFRHGLVPEALLGPLREAGAVANILSYFVDREGRPVEHEINRRIMAIPPAEVAAAGNVAIAAGGAHKVEAIRAGLVAVNASVLITDAATARVLAEED